MKLKFLGAAGGVTGSKSLLEIDNELYLIDYGLFQGNAKIREGNWNSFPHASRLTAVILTHAHIDHSGLLPRLIRDGFRGKIYCTHHTFNLCKILLADSARIHVEDAEYANKKNYSRHRPALPLYTPEDVEKTLRHFSPVDFNQLIQLSHKVSVQFYWAGHILGSSFVQFKFQQDQKERNIVFSGDIGHDRNILLNPPEPLCAADLLILESTYGDKLHARLPAKDVLQMFLSTILKRGGVAVIPSFSVGRTQDVLYLINLLMKEKRIPQVPVILDSPLSRKANQIFLDSFAPKFVKSEVASKQELFPPTLQEIDSVVESKEIASRNGPMIIVSASGMIDGGRVVHHIKARISDKRNGVILVGFQPVGTKGRLLIEGEKMLRLHKIEHQVEADIFYVNSLSAHADYLDTIEWLKKAPQLPGFIILNHGEPLSSKNLKTLIESQLEIKTTIAQMDEEFDLNALW